MISEQRRQDHLLVVDDDQRICQMLTRYFEDEGYQVTTASDGAEMRLRLKQDVFDMILLDLMLPTGEDGLTLAKEIRMQSDVPIIMLTGRDDVVDRIVGLEIGADDYIAKPFHLREVHARMKTIFRRRVPASKPEAKQEDIIHFDDWQLNFDRRQLIAGDGSEMQLTTGEFDMLAALVRHAGRVLGRERLMDLTRGRNLEAFDRSIDAQIGRLRKKIEEDPKHPKLIKSVRGVGYVFTVRL
ncbi:response regulator [Rhizobium sp. P40RR-XXII]|uniref:response regulator n=1 Tax=Rhizobium sp. P40RR-XXII TaxID=2726739 RepID=UPI00145784CF|nr:response regulator [Rhizobium sp. P40RR-XXII]NLS20423.1 response regulator [Rhizobium sp. P40RR-XXII]